MRFADIVAAAVANSFRSRLRTTLTVIAIVIGAFTLTLTNGLGAGVNAYIDGQLASIGAPDVMNVTKPVVATNQTVGPKPYEEGGPSEIQTNVGPPGSTVLAMDDADLMRIREVSGITSVEPLVSVRPDWIEYGDRGKFQLSVSPLSAGVRIDLAAGSGFDKASRSPQIVLPTTYVETLGYRDYDDAVGSTVSIGITDSLGETTIQEATVVGVQEPTLFGTTPSLNDSLTTALFDAQNTGIPEETANRYSSATAKFSADATDEQIQAIRERLVDAGFAGTTVKEQIGIFQAVIDGIILVLNAFAVIALLAASFGIINTLLMSVQERTREIGLMKAMGMSGGRVFALFSSEAVFIGVLGSAIGAVLAIIVGVVISSVLADGPVKDLAGLQVFRFTPGAIAVIVLLVMAIAFIASVLPASRAARQSPIDSLRYE